MKQLPYIAVIVLLFIVLLQNRSCDKKGDVIVEKRDTVVVYKHIVDTIPGKPVLIKTKIDTSVWMKKSEYKPDTSYVGLLSQYKKLGNAHFSTNVYRTPFQIADFGYVAVTDSISGNKLISSTLETSLVIPTEIITIEKTLPPKNQLYVGTTLTGSKVQPISGVYGGMMLKTKKDKLYGLSVGYTGQVQLGVSLYWKIK